jgi:hypothetical protein
MDKNTYTKLFESLSVIENMNGSDINSQKTIKEELQKIKDILNENTSENNNDKEKNPETNEEGEREGENPETNKGEEIKEEEEKEEEETNELYKILNYISANLL